MDSRSLNTNTIENNDSEVNRTGQRPALASFIKGNKGFCVALALFLVSFVLNIVARFVPSFAEWLSKTVVAFYTRVAGTVSGFFGFSLAEFAVLMLVPTIIVICLHCIEKGEGRASLFPLIKKPLCFLLVVATVFSLTSVCYFRKPIAPQIGIERKEPELQELLDAMTVCNAHLALLCPEITADYKGVSHCSLSYDEIAEELIASYDKMDYDFLADMDILPKPLSLAGPMAKFQTTGIFLFLTGEAHYNPIYPDFVTVNAMAHEMAHQRGVMREDEASFMAFLACINSENPYIRYSGYVSMLNSLAGAALEKDSAATLEVTATVPPQVIRELSQYGQFLMEHESGLMSLMANLANHFYLKVQDQDAGVGSYSLVVELATAWLNKSKI